MKSNTTKVPSIKAELEAACEDAGTNITAMCVKVGIARSTITRWDKKTPLSMQIYLKLLAEIAKVKAKKGKPATAK